MVDAYSQCYKVMKRAFA